MINSVGIFCGSSKGSSHIYEDYSKKYVELLVSSGIKIVFGGGSIGIMGVVAKVATENSGYIIGIAPKFLMDKEVVTSDLNELILVDTMFERKEKLIELSDAFAILPGGIGTMDEFFEVFTALQLETISKPIGILNVAGYFDHLISFLEEMVNKQFFRQEHFNSLIIEDDINIFHKKMTTFNPVKVEKWVEKLKKEEKF